MPRPTTKRLKKDHAAQRTEPHGAAKRLDKQAAAAARAQRHEHAPTAWAGRRVLGKLVGKRPMTD